MVENPSLTSHNFPHLDSNINANTATMKVAFIPVAGLSSPWGWLLRMNSLFVIIRPSRTSTPSQGSNPSHSAYSAMERRTSKTISSGLSTSSAKHLRNILGQSESSMSVTRNALSQRRVGENAKSSAGLEPCFLTS
jgi:hypothetical protein